MANSVLSFLVRRLGNFLEHEIKILMETRDRVLDGLRTLDWIRVFLDEAETRLAADRMLCKFICETREAAYDIEDTIAPYFSAGTVRRTMNAAMRRSVHTAIEAVNRRLDNLSANFRTYDLKELGSTENERLTTERINRETVGHLIDPDIVGFEERVGQLVDLLSNGVHSHRIVAISGMGGSGKTVLARAVYNNTQVRCHFKHFGWLYISRQRQEPRLVLEELLVHLTNPQDELRREIANLQYSEVAKEVYDFLRQNKCLVVLDDIWTADALLGFNNWLPLARNGDITSKILLTTRNKDVTAQTGTSAFTYELGCLDGNTSWDLLQSISNLGNHDAADREQMEELGRKMVEHCGGLPFAIKLLGGILSQNPTLHDWERIHDRVSDVIHNGGTEGQNWDKAGVLRLLSLSYYELPAKLRPCFLFLAQFSHGTRIRVKELCQMWIAEGFTDQEVKAYNYFDGLVKRYMVEIEERGSKGNIKTCYMHDLVREFCLFQAREENFLEIDSFPNTFEPRGVWVRVRRLSVCLNDHATAKNWDQMRDRYDPCLRSFMCFNLARDLCYEPKKLNRLFNRFLLLRILKLENMSNSTIKVMGEFPKTIGHLTQLRLLSLRGTFIKELPSTIENLRCLQILDLRTRWKVKLGDKFRMLEHLRHLYLPEEYTVKGSRLRLENHKSLQTLVNISTVVWGLNELEELSSLKKLSIHVDANYRRSVPANRRFENVKSLTISSKDNTIDVTPLISIFPSISKLHLAGLITRLPNWGKPDHNLCKLTLDGMDLSSNQLLILGRLQRLATLNLTSDKFERGAMCCNRQQFPGLRYLRLVKLNNLQRWTVNEGAFPNLRHLHIERCENLSLVPEGLKYIGTLKVIVIKGMLLGFENRVREAVQHIPSAVNVL